MQCPARYCLEFWNQTPKVHNWPLPLTIDDSFNFSEPQFIHLKNGPNDNMIPNSYSQLCKLLMRFKLLMDIMLLAKCLLSNQYMGATDIIVIGTRCGFEISQ